MIVVVRDRRESSHIDNLFTYRERLLNDTEAKGELYVALGSESSCREYTRRRESPEVCAGLIRMMRSLQKPVSTSNHVAQFRESMGAEDKAPLQKLLVQMGRWGKIELFSGDELPKECLM